MANTDISQAAAQAACNAIVDLIDGGTGAGYIEIRTGTKPANPDAAATGTLLATLTCSDPAFGNATLAGPSVATANSITDDTSADATGTATWFRCYDSNNVAIIDGDVSTQAAGTGDLQLDDTAIEAGGIVSITSWTVSMPTG